MFIALGQPTNSRYQHMRAFARKNQIVFLLPERVYEEIAGLLKKPRHRQLRQQSKRGGQRSLIRLTTRFQLCRKQWMVSNDILRMLMTDPLMKSNEQMLHLPHSQHNISVQERLHMHTFTQPTSLQGKVPKPYLHRTGTAMQSPS